MTDMAAPVIEDADSQQRLLDIAAKADAAEGIRQGLEDVAKGRTRSLREFLASFWLDRGISR